MHKAPTAAIIHNTTEGMVLVRIGRIRNKNSLKALHPSVHGGGLLTPQHVLVLQLASRAVSVVNSAGLRDIWPHLQCISSPGAV